MNINTDTQTLQSNGVVERYIQTLVLSADQMAVLFISIVPVYPIIIRLPWPAKNIYVVQVRNRAK